MFHKGENCFLQIFSSLHQHFSTMVELDVSVEQVIGWRPIVIPASTAHLPHAAVREPDRLRTNVDFSLPFPTHIVFNVDHVEGHCQEKFRTDFMGNSVVIQNGFMGNKNRPTEI